MVRIFGDRIVSAPDSPSAQVCSRTSFVEVKDGVPDLLGPSIGLGLGIGWNERLDVVE